MARMRRSAALAASCTAVLAAPTALVPQASPALESFDNSTVDLRSHESASTTTGQIFCIGANKAGTTSLKFYFDELAGGWNPCHNECEGVQWWLEAKHHNKESQIWKKHRAFMDNGDSADFEWLFDTFPDARFVDNVRGMHDWLLSRYDMVRAIRLGGGCSEVGSTETCAKGRYNAHSSESTWTGNSDADIRSWVLKMAKKQEKQVDFFKQPGHLNRFVQVDMTDDTRSKEMLSRLAWIERENLKENPVKKLMTVDEKFPYEMAAKGKLPNALSAPHQDESVRHVRKVLKEAGCEPHTWGQYNYRECAAKIEASKLELAKLPESEPFPLGDSPSD